MMSRLLFVATPIIATAAGQLIEDHFLSLPTLFGVLGIVLPATWWLSRKFTRVDTRLKLLETAIANLPCGEIVKKNLLLSGGGED